MIKFIFITTRRKLCSSISSYQLYSSFFDVLVFLFPLLPSSAQAPIPRWLYTHHNFLGPKFWGVRFFLVKTWGIKKFQSKARKMDFLQHPYDIMGAAYRSRNLYLDVCFCLLINFYACDWKWNLYVPQYVLSNQPLDG